MSLPHVVPADPPVVPLLPMPGGSTLAGLPLPASVTCANCLAPLFSAYCGECGAPRPDDRPLTVRRLLADAWAEVTNIDSGTLRTARSIVLRPGEMTRAYLEGRTRWFLSPVRVFFLAFAVYLASESLLPGSPEQAVREAERQIQQSRAARTATTPPAPTTAARAQRPKSAASLRRDEVMRRFERDYVGSLMAAFHNPWLQLLLVWPWAGVLALLYRRHRRNLAQHGVMALQLLAANWLLLSLNNALHAALGMPKTGFDVLSPLHWLAIGTYFHLASRAVYDEPAPRTAGKAVLFVAGAQVAMFIVPTVAGAWLVARFAVQMVLAG